MQKSQLRELIKEELNKQLAQSIKRLCESDNKHKSLMDIMYESQVAEGIKNGTSGYTIYGEIIALHRGNI